MAYPTTDALGYERLMGRWSCLLAEPFLDFTGHGDEEQVLDIGCGTGNLTRALAARTCGGGLTGVDLSPVYVAYAQGHTSDSRCSFYENDATHLMFADGRFDRVLSLLVLQFIPDWQTALAEMRRVAKPGAIIGAAVWDNRGGFVSQRLFWDTAAAVLPHAIEQRNRHCTCPLTRPGELASALRATGIENVAETCLAIRMVFESVKDYWAAFEGQEGPVARYVGALAGDERNRLREAVRSAYLDGEPDGSRSYAALAWAAKGTAPR